jgi:hypothetical protein
MQQSCIILIFIFMVMMFFFVARASNQLNLKAESAVLQITREIMQAGHCPTMRGYFGCIFKATQEYTTRVWLAFYMRIMDT